MPFPPKVDALKILQMAVEIFEKEGWAGLSMRALARKLGVTVSSLYRYYPEKSSLESAMAALAATELRIKFEKAGSFEDASLTYRQFARDHPALFSLLFDGSGGARQGEPFKALWNAFLGIVATLTGNSDDTDSAVAIWAFLHGFATLEHAGQFGPSGPKGGFERGINALVLGLRRQAAAANETAPTKALVTNELTSS